eukprot:12038084-Ditylum_brightwellii.AAC.1
MDMVLQYISNMEAMAYSSLDCGRSTTGQWQYIGQIRCISPCGHFALQYAVDLWNNVPDIQSRLSTIDKFSGTVNDHTCLLSAHMWGCFAYVLDPKLQDGKKLSKWSPQKRQRQFLGWSQSYVPLVALVYNLCTGSIIPQFHTVMED